MRNKLAVLLLSSLAAMLIQPAAYPAAVYAADAGESGAIYPTKDKFDDGNVVLNGDSGLNYIGYRSDYGQHSTHLHYTLGDIDQTRNLEKVELVVPILNGNAVRTQSTVNPYIKLFGSDTDDWSEAGTTFADLPVYNAADDYLGKGEFEYQYYQDYYASSPSTPMVLRFDVTPFIREQLAAVEDLEASFVLAGPTVADVSNVSGLRINIINIKERESSNQTGVPYLEYKYAANQAPTDISLSNSGIAENSAVNTLVGTFSASDPDAGDTHSYSLSGSGAAFFAVSGNELRTTGVPDFELQSSYSLTVEATDSAGNKYSKDFSVNVTDVAEKPVITEVKVNGGAAYTRDEAVTVSVTYSDPENNVTKLLLSNDNSVWTELNAVSPLAWTLAAGDGGKTVYIKAKDATDLESSAQNAAITLDASAPSGSLTLAGGSASVNRTDIQLTIVAADAVQMRFSNTGVAGDWSSWESAAVSKGWTLSAGDGVKTVYMELIDAAGNVSQASDTILLDTVPPDGTLSIDGGDAYTTDANVELSVGFGDAVQMRFSNDSGVWNDADWKPAAAEAGWTLSGGYGEKTVYVQLKDEAGNTAIFSDTIVHRSIPAVSDSTADGTEDTALAFKAADFIYANADGTPVDSVTVLTLPEHGKLQLAGTDIAAGDAIAAGELANLRFVSEADWFGETSFDWTASAGPVGASVPADMTIRLAGVNDAPAADDLQLQTTAGVRLDGQLAAADKERDALTYAIADQPSKGTLTLDPATGKFSFTPESGHYEDVTFTYKANDGQADSNTAKVTVSNARPADSGGGYVPSIPEVTFEGLRGLAGVQAVLTYRDGVQILEVSLDGGRLKDVMDRSADGEITVQAAVQSGHAVFSMNHAFLEQLNKGGDTLNVIMNGTSYGISVPAIRGLFQDWDSTETVLKMEIGKADDDSAARLAELAAEKGFELLAAPLSYKLYVQRGASVAELTGTRGFRTLSFDGLEALKGKRPATVVQLLPNGEAVHVPTRIQPNEASFDIQARSFSGGIFALVSYNKTFNDTAGWAEPYIGELASRLIIQGTGEGRFEPHRNVTRAEFAAILTGALGLHAEEDGPSFTDVREGDRFFGAVAAAAGYGLVTGYEDRTFRPDAPITREEAMVVTARAFRLMELVPGFTQAELGASIAAFEDRDALSAWSEAAAALNVRLGIVQGSGNRLLPDEPLTRGQLAALMFRLLKAGKFI